jgi:hypothetical protein
MPLWVLLLFVVTGSVPRDSSAYRLVLGIAIFMSGWGVGLGRAALATNRGERRATPIAGLVLNVVLFVLLALSNIQPPAPAPIITAPAVETQKGRASDQ